MRKLLVLTMALLLIGGIAFGQEDTFEFNSFRSYFSEGLFDNELGAAASVIENGRGPGFSELGSNYFFFSPGFFPDMWEDEDSDFGEPLLFGLYRQENMRYSNFTGLHIEGTREVGEAVDENPQTESPGDETLEWLSDRTVRTVTAPEYFSIQNQFLTGLDGLNAGLTVEVLRNNADRGNIDLDGATRFRTLTIDTEEFYPAHQTDEIPNPQDEFSSSYELTTGGLVELDTLGDSLGNNVFRGFIGTAGVPNTINPNFVPENLPGDLTALGNVNAYEPDELDITLSAPLFLGDAHYVKPVVNYSRTDHGFRETFEFNADDLQAATTETVGEYELRSSDTTWGVGFDYSLFQSPIFGTSERNRLRIDAGAGIALRGGSYWFEGSQKTIEFDGTDETVQTSEELSFESSGQAGFDYSLSAGVSHPTYFEIDDDIYFAVGPGLSLDFDSVDDDGARSAELTLEYSSEDGDGNNLFSVDSVTETEYAARNRTNTITTVLEMPMAFSAEPEDWLLGFTASSTPSIEWERKATRSYNDTVESQSTESSSEENTNTDTTTTSTENVERELETDVEHDWTPNLENRLGFTIPLGENVTVDMAYTGENIFDFTDFHIEASVAY